MPKIRQWNVTIAHDQSLQDVSKALVAEGFAIGEVLEEIPCITGSADEDTVDRLRRIKGVVAIEPDMQISLGPPDADVTW